MAPRALKALERRWKALVMRGLAGALPRAPGGALPAWGSRPVRVLYLRYDRIGDMILATPVIRAIAGAAPGIVLDVLASPVNASVLEGNPDVHAVRVFDVKDRSRWPAVFRSLRRARYDVVVDDHAAVRKASLTMIFVMLATGARWRIGVAGQENEFIYTHPVPPAPPGHMLEMTAAVTAPFGVTPDLADWRPHIVLRAEEREAAARAWAEAERAQPAPGEPLRRRLLVNLSATHAKRRWPDERFIAAIRAIAARAPELAIGIIGSPKERDAVQRVAAATGATAIATATVRDAFALVEAATLVLTPDTSITHAATAFERPVVVMLRPIMALYLPYRVPHRAVWVAGETFADLPVEPVVDAVLSLREELTGGDGGTRL